MAPSLVKAVIVTWLTQGYENKTSKIPFADVAEADQANLVIGKTISVRYNRKWYNNEAVVKETILRKKKQLPPKRAPPAAASSSVQFHHHSDTVGSEYAPSGDLVAFNFAELESTSNGGILHASVHPTAVDLQQTILDELCAVRKQNDKIITQNEDILSSNAQILTALNLQRESLAGFSKDNFTISAVSTQSKSSIDWLCETVKHIHSTITRRYSTAVPPVPSNLPPLGIVSCDTSERSHHRQLPATAAASPLAGIPAHSPALPMGVSPSASRATLLSSVVRAATDLPISQPLLPSANQSSPIIPLGKRPSSDFSQTSSSKKARLAHAACNARVSSVDNPTATSIGGDVSLQLLVSEYTTLLAKCRGSQFKLLVSLLEKLVPNLHAYSYSGRKDKLSLKETEIFKSCYNHCVMQFPSSSFTLTELDKTAISTKCYNASRKVKPVTAVNPAIAPISSDNNSVVGDEACASHSSSQPDDVAEEVIPENNSSTLLSEEPSETCDSELRRQINIIAPFGFNKDGTPTNFRM